MAYLRIYEATSGGIVDLHPLHGEDELPANTQAAIVIAEHGYRVELLPSLPETEVELRQLWLPDVAARKNPDLRINGCKIGDIKKGIIGALQPGRNSSIEEVWIIATQKGLFKASRDMVYTESIYDILDEL